MEKEYNLQSGIGWF